MSLLPLFIVVPLGGAFLTPIISKFWSKFPDLVSAICQ